MPYSHTRFKRCGVSYYPFLCYVSDISISSFHEIHFIMSLFAAHIENEKILLSHKKVLKISLVKCFNVHFLPNIIDFKPFD